LLSSRHGSGHEIGGLQIDPAEPPIVERRHDVTAPDVILHHMVGHQANAQPDQKRLTQKEKVLGDQARLQQHLALLLALAGRYAQVPGFKAAVEWRDSGRPIPEGDEARALIRELEAQRGA